MAGLILIAIIISLFVLLYSMNKTLVCKVEASSDSNIIQKDNNKEGFSTSHGTVMQLMAKGRQDQYLTGPHAGDINPLAKLIPESTKTQKLPYFYV